MEAPVVPRVQEAARRVSSPKRTTYIKSISARLSAEAATAGLSRKPPRSLNFRSSDLSRHSSTLRLPPPPFPLPSLSPALPHSRIPAAVIRCRRGLPPDRWRDFTQSMLTNEGAGPVNAAPSARYSELQPQMQIGGLSKSRKGFGNRTIMPWLKSCFQAKLRLALCSRIFRCGHHPLTFNMKVDPCKNFFLCHVSIQCQNMGQKRGGSWHLRKQPSSLVTMKIGIVAAVPCSETWRP